MAFLVYILCCISVISSTISITNAITDKRIRFRACSWEVIAFIGAALLLIIATTQIRQPTTMEVETTGDDVSILYFGPTVEDALLTLNGEGWLIEEVETNNDVKVVEATWEDNDGRFMLVTILYNVAVSLDADKPRRRKGWNYSR